MTTFGDYINFEPAAAHDYQWRDVMQACIDSGHARWRANRAHDLRMSLWLRNGSAIVVQIPDPANEHGKELTEMIEITALGYHAVGASLVYPFDHHDQLCLVTALRYAETPDRLNAMVNVCPLFLNPDGTTKAIGLSFTNIDRHGFNIGSALELLAAFIRLDASDSERAEARASLHGFPIADDIINPTIN